MYFSFWDFKLLKSRKSDLFLFDLLDWLRELDPEAWSFIPEIALVNIEHCGCGQPNTETFDPHSC